MIARGYARSALPWATEEEDTSRRTENSEREWTGMKGVNGITGVGMGRETSDRFRTKKSNAEKEKFITARDTVGS
jgi:hypothetical protein